LGEAMLCGCIPIGSDAASIPEIIGDTGFILKKRDAGELKTLIFKALQSNKRELSEKAINRIKENWPSEKRESGLKSIIDTLVQ
ncbi:MAG: glycosyltransferase, partial [Chitinophagales bacterium]